MSGLFLVKSKRKRAPNVAAEKACWSGMSDTERPQIEYMWRNEAGEVCRRIRKWGRPQTEQAISEWMQDYFDLVADGYLPEGHEVAPVPFCARVTVGARVKAEWISKDERIARSRIAKCK